MNVPKLRFKEFSGEWDRYYISDITTKVGSGSTPKGGQQVYQSTGVPFIRSQNVNNDRLILSDVTYISDTIHNQMKGSWVKPLDILLNITGASIGRSCVVPLDFQIGNVNQHVCIIRLNDQFSSNFIQSYLSSDRGQEKVLSSQVGGGREGLNFQAIRKFELAIPLIPEQTKIASFLTAIDDKIAQLTQKHELLSQYKKGVMQQIFSQQLRFKDDNGEEFGEWDEVTIGDFFTVTRGQVLAANQTKENKDKEYFYPVYSSQTKKNGLMGYYYSYLYEDAITWTTDGANAGDVKFRSGKFYCTNVCGVLLSNKGLANQCVAEILNTITHKYVSYVGNPKLMNNVMASISIRIPSEITEQTKIANFLSSIDQKIEQAAAQLDAAKQYKRGLLQQMFV